MTMSLTAQWLTDLLRRLFRPTTAPAPVTAPMRTSERGRRLIEQFEGLRLSAYQDATGVWTIGYGHTGPVNGVSLRAGMHITEQTADRLLVDDLATAEATVRLAVSVPLTQEQFDALVSWTFNLGFGALVGSTMLRRINEGKWSEAADQLLLWDHAGGQKLAGLTKRRWTEHDLFLHGVYPDGIA
jgi:lysozyme